MMIVPSDEKRAAFFRKYKNPPKDMIEQVERMKIIYSKSYLCLINLIVICLQFIGNVDKYEKDLMFFEVTVRVIRH